MSNDFTRTQIAFRWQCKPQLNDLIPPTPSNLKLSPQVEERKGWAPHSSLGTPSPSVPQPPWSTNKEGFVQRMNEDSFLLGVLLKLESRGLLPSMTPVGSPQPNLQMPLVSNGHLAGG